MEKELQISILEKDLNFDFQIKPVLEKQTETLDPQENKNRSLRDYYLMPVTANCVYEFKAQINQIQVIRRDDLNLSQHYLIKKAEKYANLFYQRRLNTS